MAYVDWMIKGPKIASCSCDYGCPCEFNAPPTRAPCEGLECMRIEEGYFADVRLDGLRADDPLPGVKGCLDRRPAHFDLKPSQHSYIVDFGLKPATTLLVMTRPITRRRRRPASATGAVPATQGA